MKKYLALVLGVFLFGCQVDEPSVTAGGAEYFIFGTFAGFCQGEHCIEIYKYEAGTISEDQADVYPDWTQGHQGEYEERPELLDLTDRLDMIIATLPSGLAAEANRVFGCPDCADQGGVYIELKDVDVDPIFWLFDNDLDQVPEEYRTLVRTVSDLAAEID